MNRTSTSLPLRRWNLARWIVRRLRSKRRGQALVEFALFVPVLLLMVVGATDISTLLDNHLDVVYAARAGARVGSVIGKYAPAGALYTADCAVVGAVQAALASSRNVQVSQIAIYKSDATGVYSNSLPQDVYAGNAVCNANGSVTPAASKATWAPSTRDTDPFSEDSIGVAITYTYTYSFNLIGIGSFTTTDYAVMPVEVVIGTPPAQPTATSS